MVLAFLVVGVGGLVSIRLSTVRSGAITDVVDPALTANAGAWQLAADTRMSGLSPDPAKRPTAAAARPAPARR